MTSAETFAVLRTAPLLGLLEEDALRVIVNVADSRTLREGEVLFRQHERSDGGYAVVRGRIGLRRSDEDEDVATAGPGALVGKVALFLRMQRPATALALEPSTVLRISPTLMKRVLQEYPSAAAGMRSALARDLDSFAGRLRQAETLLAALDEA